LNASRVLADQPLTSQVLGLLSSVFGFCVGTVRATVGRGSATSEHIQPAGYAWGHLPDWLLRELRPAIPDDIRFALASFRPGHQPAIADVPALWVEIFQRAVMPRRAWEVDAELRAAALSRIAAFPLAPSFVLDQRFNLLAIWQLDRPAPRRLEAQLEELQRALAIALGGRTELERVPRARSSGGASFVEMPACSLRRPVLRVPGSHNHDRAIDEPVRLLGGDPDRRYRLEEIIAAVQPAPAAAGRRDSAARFNAREPKEPR
jgi:hypothetical protein